VTQTVFIRIDTLAARARQDDTALPALALTLAAAMQVDFAFVTGADAVAPLDGTVITVQCCVKARPDDTDALLLDASCDYSGAGITARYSAVWTTGTLDGPALRTFLGPAFSRIGDAANGPWMEVAWTIDGATQRVAFPIMILNAWLRPEDTAPDPHIAAAEGWLTGRAVRFDEVQTLTDAQKIQALENIGIHGIKSITKTAGGFLNFVFADDSTGYIGFTSGSAPA
jgi:hypothetical protein